ncbi:MAG: non-canonical purine NTP pyrophosphatase [Candidatus Sericytochromatia bacterium]|nr:non-canonical purine NTP pyrophosphatase [Candidatus Sericytochromatia bacterium]
MLPESLLLITGNAHKLREVQQVLPGVQGWDLDLPEIQQTDPRRVIEAKLLEAARLSAAPALMVEDTSLYLAALGELPGPLTKWFIQPGSLGLEELVALARRRGQTAARASTWLGLLLRQNTNPGLQMFFFEGSVNGQLVPPRGSQGFGWDPIFVPAGSTLTFAEMDANTKQCYSMRSLALKALIENFEPVS